MKRQGINIYEVARKKKIQELYINDSRPKWKEDLTNEQLDSIERHADRFGHTIQEVIDAVIGNEVAYRFVLGKHVGRMDYWETALAEYLNGLPMVRAAEKLPKGGNGRLYVINGKLQNHKPDSLHIKSIDIKVEFKNEAVAYIIHKFTGEAGGAQDNQWREAVAALEQVKGNTGSTVNLIAVLDGNYYLLPRRSASGLSRLEETRNQHPNAIVCTYENFTEATKAIWDRAAGG